MLRLVSLTILAALVVGAGCSVNMTSAYRYTVVDEKAESLPQPAVSALSVRPLRVSFTPPPTWTDLAPGQWDAAVAKWRTGWANRWNQELEREGLPFRAVEAPEGQTVTHGLVAEVDAYEIWRRDPSGASVRLKVTDAASNRVVYQAVIYADGTLGKAKRGAAFGFTTRFMFIEHKAVRAIIQALKTGSAVTPFSPRGPRPPTPDR